MKLPNETCETATNLALLILWIAKVSICFSVTIGVSVWAWSSGIREVAYLSPFVFLAIYKVAMIGQKKRNEKHKQGHLDEGCKDCEAKS